MEKSRSLFTVLPFGQEAKIYRGMMPKLNDIDKFSKCLESHEIGVVVLLCSYKECEDKFPNPDKKGIKDFYERRNIEIVYFPIQDFSTPKIDDLIETVGDIKTRAEKEPKNILIHCYGGIGRTGLVLACLAIAFFKMSPPDSIEWVRRFVPGAVENEKQEKVVAEFASRSKPEREEDFFKLDDQPKCFSFGPLLRKVTSLLSI